jgi:hypothetical protein
MQNIDKIGKQRRPERHIYIAGRRKECVEAVQECRVSIQRSTTT